MRYKIVGILLFAWEPLNFAAEAIRVLPTIRYRGVLAACELFAHACVAAVAAGAGLALINGASEARRLAIVAIAFTTARVLQSLYWSVLPNNTVPGTEWFYAAITLTIGIAAITALSARLSR